MLFKDKHIVLYRYKHILLYGYKHIMLRRSPDAVLALVGY
jgi:hypothetical protein